MTALNIRKFDGEVPRSPGNLLPDSSAQQASWCDLGAELNPLRGGTFVATAPSIPTLKGIYSDKEGKWYGWPIDVYGVDSPVVDDVYQRMYYVHEGWMWGAYVPSKGQLGTNAPEVPPDANRWLNGVPAPIAAPILSIYEEQSLPENPDAVFQFEYWYSADNNTYQRATATYTTVSALREYSLTNIAAPANPTPDGAVLVVEMTIIDGTKTLLRVSTAEGEEPARSSALPGGLEVKLLKSGSNWNIVITWGVVETRAYVVTCVDQFLEESAPSPPALISTTYVQSVQILKETPTSTYMLPQWFPIDHPGNANGGVLPYAYAGAHPIFYYIYRTYSGVSTYFRCKRIQWTENAAIGWTQDDINWRDTTHTPPSDSQSLTTIDWNVPPWGLATSNPLVAMQGGWFATFSEYKPTGAADGLGNTLYMSQPYRPHAWPYSVAFDTPIMGICASAQSLVVVTTNACYQVVGAHPASVQTIRTPLPVGGVSQRGMCQIEGGVAYVSNDGIVLVSGSNASLEWSQQLWTREKWHELYGDVLSEMYLTYHDGKLVAVVNSGGVNKGFMVRLDETAGELTTLTAPSFNSICRLPLYDAAFYTQGSSIYKFDDDSTTPQTFTWHSKEFTFNAPTKFGAFFVRPQSWARTQLLYNIAIGASTLTTFNGGGAKFPASGMLRIIDSNGNFEIVGYARSGDTFSLVAGVSRSYITGTVLELNYILSVRLYLDGTEYYSTVVNKEGYYRIPAVNTINNIIRDGVGRRWSISLNSNCVVYEFAMAQDMKELRRV